LEKEELLSGKFPSNGSGTGKKDSETQSAYEERKFESSPAFMEEKRISF